MKVTRVFYSATEELVTLVTLITLLVDVTSISRGVSTLEYSNSGRKKEGKEYGIYCRKENVVLTVTR